MNKLDQRRASYFAWHPALDSRRGAISVLLTQGLCRLAPVGGEDFAAAITAAAGLGQIRCGFACEEFVTSYFGGDAGSVRWEECWEARLFVSEVRTKASLVPLARYAIGERPERCEEIRRQIPMRVVADFDTRTRAQECRAEIQRRADLEEIRWPDRYRIRSSAGSRHQLWVDIGTRRRPELLELVTYAVAVGAICREFDGKLHWEGPDS